MCRLKLLLAVSKNLEPIITATWGNPMKWDRDTAPRGFISLRSRGKVIEEIRKKKIPTNYIRVDLNCSIIRWRVLLFHPRLLAEPLFSHCRHFTGRTPSALNISPPTKVPQVWNCHRRRHCCLTFSFSPLWSHSWPSPQHRGPLGQGGCSILYRCISSAGAV